MVRSSRLHARVVTLSVFAAACAPPARAQAPPPPEEVSVTADRVAVPLDATGSDVTVIPGATVTQWGPQGIVEALREVPGVSVTQTAGPSSTTEIRLRGADPGEALVMIDGVPLGDAAGTDGSVDFGNLTALDIDRIEIVRGPQSALYGSDAMAGVINIITRRGAAGQAPAGTLSVEGGSYGTIEARASIAGARGDWTYAFGLELMHTDGFPEFGYRIDRPITLEDGVTPLPRAPDIEPSQKGAVSGRLSYQAARWLSFDAGYDVFGNELDFANPYVDTAADVFDPYNRSKTWIGNGFLRANLGAAGSLLPSHVTLFGNVTAMDVREREACDNALFEPFDCTNSYRGSRWGVEEQSELSLGRVGALVFGARNMNERATTSEDPDPHDSSFTPIDATQITNSGYAEYRVAPLHDLDVTLGGRIDGVERAATFETGRATVAYRIEATGTKLRAAFGDGAKVATLYQRFSPYGTPGLAPERNVGGEIGIDQALFAGRLRPAVTLFRADYTDLIGFADVPSCATGQLALGGCYYNIGHARTQGVEATLDLTIVADILTARAEYTYTDAVDTQTRTEVLRVPPQQGALSLTWSAASKLKLTPRVLLVGPQHDSDAFTGATVVLPGTVRLDLLAAYQVTKRLSAELRLENLTDARIEEVYDYGEAGRTVYGGLREAF